MKIFKIRHRLTGLFYEGSVIPTWSEHGKSWRTVGYANAAITNSAVHLATAIIVNMSSGSRIKATEDLLDLDNWEIVHYNLEEVDAEIVTYKDHINSKWLREKLPAKGITVK